MSRSRLFWNTARSVLLFILNALLLLVYGCVRIIELVSHHLRAFLEKVVR